MRAEIDPRYSAPEARPIPWETAREELLKAGISYVSTVRPEGRPHVTPLMTVWHDGALHFTTGPEERKARNLAANPECVLTTVTDLAHFVVEGKAQRLQDETVLHELARLWHEKYGDDWQYQVRDGAFHHDAGEAWVFQVRPVTAFGFAKDPPGQTRWK